MTTEESIEGGCLCGATRYKIEFPNGATYQALEPHTCQCTQCRKQSGALILHFITIPKSRVTWSGAPPSEFQSSPDVKRKFCSACGTCFAYESDEESEREIIEIMTGTVDQDVLMGPRAKELTRPMAQVWCCRTIKGVTDVFNSGTQYDKGP